MKILSRDINAVLNAFGRSTVMLSRGFNKGYVSYKPHGKLVKGICASHEGPLTCTSIPSCKANECRDNVIKALQKIGVVFDPTNQYTLGSTTTGFMNETSKSYQTISVSIRRLPMYTTAAGYDPAYQQLVIMANVVKHLKNA